ncbi:nucleoid-associated protein [Erysipelothrix urinaevulpis]|uniref:nucleoid-associated protein n=1 Tax=Erysipelothrix urinaevulpis TaxID=2683717 RepID=UPI0013573823|nr:nucleoid-associated protein [Erysipelothrix urinaevulpis]
MKVQKIIIHSLDEDLKTEIYSDRQMNLNDQLYVGEYIERFARSCVNSSKTYTGRLNQTSPFHELIDDRFDFLEWSKKLARQWFSFHKTQEQSKNVNLLFALVENTDTLYFTGFEVHASEGFIRITQDNQVIENQIIHNNMILPNTFASVKSAFMFDCEFGTLYLNGNPLYHDFFKDVFDCELIANSKQSFSVIQSTIQEVMAKRDLPSLESHVKVKEILGDVAQDFDIVSCSDLIEEVLQGTTEEEKHLIESRFEEEDVEDDLNLKNLKKSRVLSRHKFKTESGIEIIFPVNELDMGSVIEIIENDDGTKDMRIKNVGEVA